MRPTSTRPRLGALLRGYDIYNRDNLPGRPPDLNDPEQNRQSGTAIDVVEKLELFSFSFSFSKIFKSDVNIYNIQKIYSQIFDTRKVFKVTGITHCFKSIATLESKKLCFVIIICLFILMPLIYNLKVFKLDFM